MNVGIVYKDFDSNAGDAIDVRCIAFGFLNQGHSVTVFCNKNKKNKILHPNLRYIRSSKLTNLLFSIYKYRNEFDFAHLFCGMIWQLFPISILLSILKVPFCYSAFGQVLPMSYDKKALKKKVYSKLALKFIIGNAKFCHSVSEYEANFLKDKFNARSMIQPLGIDNLPFSENKIHAKPKNFLFLGRLDVWHKGLDLLIDAISECSDYLRKENVKFTLAGRGTRENIENLKSMLNHRNVNDLVKIKDNVSEKEKNYLLTKSNWFVHPSRVEGFARSMRESLNMGLPILTTFSSNNGEQINKALLGLSVGFSHLELADAIKDIVEGNIKLSENIVSCSRAEFNWNKLCTKLIDEYSVYDEKPH